MDPVDLALRMLVERGVFALSHWQGTLEFLKRPGDNQQSEHF